MYKIEFKKIVVYNYNIINYETTFKKFLLLGRSRI